MEIVGVGLDIELVFGCCAVVYSMEESLLRDYGFRKYDDLCRVYTCPWAR
jgi:hypothetical protein